MSFALPINYDKIMKKFPYGKVLTLGKVWEYFAKLNGAKLTELITTGCFFPLQRGQVIGV